MLSMRYYAPQVAETGSFPPPGGATPYADLVASLGAVSYWPLQSDAVDAVGAHDLTLVGSPTYGTGPGGELASALALVAASNQHGYVSHADFRPTTALSYCAWFNPASTGTAKGILSCGGTGFTGWTMRQSNTTIVVKVGDGSANQGVINSYTTLAVDGSVWYFAGYTFDAATNATSLYVDGTEDDSSPGTFAFDIGYSSDVLYVGSWDGNSARDFDGRIAGAAVFPNIVLTAANFASLAGAL